MRGKSTLPINEMGNGNSRGGMDKQCGFKCVEMGRVDPPRDESRLKQKEKAHDVAKGLFKGIHEIKLSESVSLISKSGKVAVSQMWKRKGRVIHGKGVEKGDDKIIGCEVGDKRKK